MSFIQEFNMQNVIGSVYIKIVTCREQTWPWSKDGVRRAHRLGAHPWLWAAAPARVVFRRPLRHSRSSCHIFSKFFVHVVKFVCYVIGCLPHTCFLLSFIHSMVEIETKAKHIQYIITNSLFQYHLRHFLFTIDEMKWNWIKELN
jgi:hypothetical protein